MLLVDINSKANNKISILLLAFYVLLFLKFKYAAILPIVGMMSSFLVSFLALGITFFFFFYKLKVHFEIQLFVFLMFVFGYSTSVFTQNYRLNDYLLNIQYFGIALIPLFYKLNYQMFKFALYILLVFFCINIIMEIDPNEVFSVSRNSISVFILIFYSYYVIASIQNKKNHNLWVLVVCFFVSIWAVGRGGIMAIGLLLLLMPYCRQSRFSLKMICTYFFIFVVGYCSLMLFSDSILTLAITRFDSMGFDPNGRDEPNSEYLNRLFDSYFNFVYGVNLPGNSAFEALDLNPHNSLIRLHIYYGICGFILVAGSTIRALIIFMQKNNLVYALLLITLIVRSLVDSTAFHGPFDGLIYYFIFYTFCSRDTNLIKSIEKVNYVRE